MVKPLDLSKFRKSITKSISGISLGFNDPKTWLSTGNYVLNYILSGSFDRGVPLGKVTMLAGESGSGKSLIAASIMKEAQKKDILVIAFDSENAHDESWLTNAGVDTDPTKYLRIQVAMIDDVAKSIHEFMDGYKSDYGQLDEEERPQVLFVIDSLGALLTPTDVAQFEKGDLKGDFGRKPKALNALIRNCVIQFAEYDIGLVATNHTYESQDMFNPDLKISGGGGFIYASSQVIAMRRLNLKEDAEGNKTTTIQGIRASIKVMKTRFTKPFETMHLKIPYSTGIDEFSGLVDFLEAKNYLMKDGNKLKYIDLEGNEYKWFRKGWETTEGRVILTKIMDEFELREKLNQTKIEDEERLITETPADDIKDEEKSK